MTKRTKALAISKKTKQIVHKRDNYCCVLCGSPNGLPNAHYISRAQSGLGIEQNIVTLCPKCHYDYDHTTDRQAIKQQIKRYLQSEYKDWNEKDLVYKRWDET